MLRIGVIGCGRIAQVRHLPEYLDNKDCQIVAVTDMNQARAQEMAQFTPCLQMTRCSL
jgi:predicted dehydrogenase